MEILHGKSNTRGNRMRSRNVPNMYWAGVGQRKTALLGYQTHVQSRTAKTAAFTWKAAHLMRLLEPRVNKHSRVIVDRFGCRSARQWDVIVGRWALRVEIRNKQTVPTRSADDPRHRPQSTVQHTHTDRPAGRAAGKRQGPIDWINHKSIRLAGIIGHSAFFPENIDPGITRVNGSAQECFHAGISLGDHTAVRFETRPQALTTAIILPCELARFGHSREQTANRRDRWHAFSPLTLLS